MTPTALQWLRASRISSVAKGRKNLTRRNPTLLALFAHPAHGDADGHGKGAHAHQYDVGVFGHILFDEGAGVAATEDLLEFLVGFFDHVAGAAHGVVGLAADLHQPVFVDLGRHGDGVVGVEQQASAVVVGAGTG